MSKIKKVSIFAILSLIVILVAINLYQYWSSCTNYDISGPCFIDRLYYATLNPLKDNFIFKINNVKCKIKGGVGVNNVLGGFRCAFVSINKGKECSGYADCGDTVCVPTVELYNKGEEYLNHSTDLKGVCYEYKTPSTPCIVKIEGGMIIDIPSNLACD